MSRMHFMLKDNVKPLKLINFFENYHPHLAGNILISVVYSLKFYIDL